MPPSLTGEWYGPLLVRVDIDQAAIREPLRDARRDLERRFLAASRVNEPPRRGERTRCATELIALQDVADLGSIELHLDADRGASLRPAPAKAAPRECGLRQPSHFG